MAMGDTEADMLTELPTNSSWVQSQKDNVSFIHATIVPASDLTICSLAAKLTTTQIGQTKVEAMSHRRLIVFGVMSSQKRTPGGVGEATAIVEHV